jgi:HAD superfamily hydrolase (TIGR01484 family)
MIPPPIIIFDLDNTLAESKQPITEEMAALLGELLSRTRVAVMSGGALSQLSGQVADRLLHSAHRESLYLLPTSGAALFTFDGGAWKEAYREVLTDGQVSEITHALEEASRETGLVDLEHELYGPYIENRGSQVSLSALGQQAPVEKKREWDPAHGKRQALRDAAAPKLPAYDVKVGGLTTIDVTLKGINKAYGVRKLSELLSIPVSDMLYVGDELSPGGNDAVVTETGIPTRAVAGPAETMAVITEFLV